MGEEKVRLGLRLDQTELSVKRNEQSSRICMTLTEGQVVVGRQRQTAHAWTSLRLEKNAICMAHHEIKTVEKIVYSYSLIMK